MFCFLLKKTLKSKVLIALVIVTSIFLLNEFLPYFHFFPIENQKNLMSLSNVGGCNDFVQKLYKHDEQKQIEIIKSYYKEVLEKDNQLTIEERKLIENGIMKVKTVDEYYEEYTELFFYTYKIGTSDKLDYYHEQLTKFSGENYLDANRRISKLVKDYNLSYFFSMRYADRLVVIWSMFLFLFVSYRYCSQNNRKLRGLIYPRAYKSVRYVLTNIGVEIIAICIFTAIQMFSFGIFFDLHVSGVYDTSIMDYVKVYFVFIVPSIAIIIGILNFLYYVFDSPVAVFPIYYVIDSMSSKIKNNGFVINKTNLILRYDTLFKPLTDVQLNDILINRIIMITALLVLIPCMTYILDKKREGKIDIKLSMRRKKHAS